MNAVESLLAEARRFDVTITFNGDQLALEGAPSPAGRVNRTPPAV